MIKQIGLPLYGRPILLITRMITDRIGLHSVLLPLFIKLKVVTDYFVNDFVYSPGGGKAATLYLAKKPLLVTL